MSCWGFRFLRDMDLIRSKAVWRPIQRFQAGEELALTHSVLRVSAGPRAFYLLNQPGFLLNYMYHLFPPPRALWLTPHALPPCLVQGWALGLQETTLQARGLPSLHTQGWLPPLTSLFSSSGLSPGEGLGPLQMCLL